MGLKRACRVLDAGLGSWDAVRSAPFCCLQSTRSAGVPDIWMVTAQCAGEGGGETAGCTAWRKQSGTGRAIDMEPTVLSPNPCFPFQDSPASPERHRSVPLLPRVLEGGPGEHALPAKVTRSCDIEFAVYFNRWSKKSTSANKKMETELSLSPSFCNARKCHIDWEPSA